jgi:sarcosine oxidase subunit gamma
MSTTPTLYTRRGQLYRRHCSADVQFEEIAGSAVVSRYTEADDEVGRATHLALADLSTLPRIGFKGVRAPSWLEEQGVQRPDYQNRAKRNEDGSLIARLSTTEFLILGDLASNSTLIPMLQNRWSLESTDRVYSLPRGDSHCWFAITGAHAPTTLSKVCGVDLRKHKFGKREIAQTSLARTNAIILRNDFATTPGFFILSDVSLTEYLWDSLLDAMLEFDGSPVGIEALRTLEENEF